MKRAFIFGGGAYDELFPELFPEDIIIAADAGRKILDERGITPHITVGDFDSFGNIPDGDAIVLPVEKDVTDSHAASDIAIEKGCEEIYIYGGMGGRPDHTFANYTLLSYLLGKGVKAFLVGEGYSISLIRDSSCVLYGKKGQTVSVFSWSEKCEGVSLKGLKYPLCEATLSNGFALGVSNSFLEDTAEISVKKGTLLIMQSLG